MDYPGVEKPKKSMYSPAKTGIKGGKETVAGSVAGLIAMWIAARIWGADIAAEQLALYAAILVGPVSGGLMMLRNIVREIARRYGFDFRNILPMLLAVAVASMLMGCGTTAKTRHLETHWEAGADGQLYEVTVDISAKTRAGVFGAVPEGVHNVNAEWSAEKDIVQLGQAVRLDNTAQVQGLEIAMPFIQAIFSGAFSALTAMQAPSTPGQVGFSPEQATELERIFEILGDRINLVGKRVRVLEAPLATE